MTIASLLTGVIAQLKTLTTVPALSGIWLGVAPEGVKYPFITLQVPDVQEGRSMGTSPARWKEAVVTIDIWGDTSTPAAIITISEQIETLFHNAQPLGSSYPLCIDAVRTSYIVLEEQDGFHRVSMDYVFTMEDS